MLKEIPKSDITVRPSKFYKEYKFTQSDILPIFGKEDTTSAFNTETDETTGLGLYKRVVYQSVKTQFYNQPATASILTEVGKRKSYASTDERILEDEFALIPIPQKFIGEGIKVGSLTLTDSGNVYTDDGFSNLVDGTNEIVGNIFYDRGFVVLTKNIVSGSTLSNYLLEYRSTTTIHENEIFISVLENEFNVSQNLSAHIDGKIRLNNIQSQIDPSKFGGFDDYEVSSSLDPTGSYLAPYITTIALYDDKLDMVAVAKLAQPIKSLPDYPINFIVRLDT